MRCGPLTKLKEKCNRRNPKISGIYYTHPTANSMQPCMPMQRHTRHKHDVQIESMNEWNRIFYYNTCVAMACVCFSKENYGSANKKKILQVFRQSRASRSRVVRAPLGCTALFTLFTLEIFAMITAASNEMENILDSIRTKCCFHFLCSWFWHFLRELHTFEHNLLFNFLFLLHFSIDTYHFLHLLLAIRP